MPKEEEKSEGGREEGALRVLEGRTEARGTTQAEPGTAEPGWNARTVAERSARIGDRTAKTRGRGFSLRLADQLAALEAWGLRPTGQGEQPGEDAVVHGRGHVVPVHR